MACDQGLLKPHWRGFFRCGECGYVGADVTLSDKDFQALYGENYFFDGEYLDYHQEAKALLPSFKKRLSLLKKYISGGRLIEIGCAYGHFLNLARSDFETKGYEISPSAVRHCVDRLGLDVVQENFDAALVSPSSVDAVVMWDCIEHLNAADRFIKKASEVLKPNGLLALTTGNIESLVAQIRGQHWRMIHPPTHLHYFSKRSLKVLLERNGFEIVEMRTDIFWRSFRQVAYRLFVKGNRPLPWVYQALTRLPWDPCIPLNLFDILFIVACKRAQV